MALFLDKLGERIAFERTGTRLYGALITKYLAISNNDGDPLLAVGATTGDAALAEADDNGGSEAPVDTLHRIRSDELQHFRMLCDCVTKLGGDPTAQTPCADVAAAASIGLMQVITDPRTTLAQSLSAILTAELTDNAGWELLAELAQRQGQDELAAQFLAALETEQQHLAIVQGWLKGLLTHEAGTPAV
jgi:hypothetical protein